MSYPVQRVNGALMGNFVGSKAVLVAFCKKMDPSGKKGTFVTTDEQFVQVFFNEELTFPLEEGVLVHLHGDIKAKNQFICESFAHWSKELSEDYDKEAYESFVKSYPQHSERVVIDV